MTLFSARDESLPSVGDAVRDISNGLRVVVVVGQESLSPLPDVDSAGVGFLKEETIKISWVGGESGKPSGFQTQLPWILIPVFPNNLFSNC